MPNIKSMTTTASSNISKITLTVDTKVMEVTFKGGKTYQYLGVSEEEYDAIIDGGSVGKAFNAWLKEFKGTTVDLSKQRVHEVIEVLKDMGDDLVSKELLKLLGVSE